MLLSKPPSCLTRARRDFKAPATRQPVRAQAVSPPPSSQGPGRRGIKPAAVATEAPPETLIAERDAAQHDRGISTTGNIVVFEAFKRYSDGLPMVVPDKQQQPLVLEEVEDAPGTVDYLTAGRTVKIEEYGLQEKPGDADARHGFKMHSSVQFWRDWQNPTEEGLQQSFQEAVARVSDSIVRGGRLSSAQALAYWMYHIGRSAFFITQGLAGLLATQLAANASGAPKEANQVKLGRLFRSGAAGPVLEAIATYQQDFEAIQQGRFRLPWDMTTLRHRQYNPSHVLGMAATFVQEAANTLQRRYNNKTDEVWLQSSMYPEYYTKTFHYQTDGWFSQHSANIYEASTETLFVGRQDSMQRQMLVPMHEFMQDRHPAGRGTRALEVACGTGRFATFVKDNYPELELTALDLSPYYLQEARSNTQRWRELRQPRLDMGGWQGSGVRFLQAAAEGIPEQDGSYDVVMCLYLFHEMPSEPRRRAVHEFARVLRPGGCCILGDATQLGDRPGQDAVIGNFGDFNEPWWRDYISTDLGALFQEAGLKPELKLISSATKVLSFSKPL